MSVQQMRDKLREWFPTWNIDRFTDNQIVRIYNKERNKIVQSMIDRYK